MGLLSGLKNIFSSSVTYGANDLASTISKVANTALTFIAHPVGAVTNIEKAYQTTAKESVGQLLVGGVSNTLLAVAPFTGAIKTGVAKVITSTIAKAPIKTAAVALVGGGAIVSSPTIAKKAVEVVAGAPENLFKTGEVVGGIVEKGGNILTDLSSKDVKNIAVALGGGAVVGAGAVVAYDYVKDKVMEKEEVVEKIVIGNKEKEVAVGENKQTPASSSTSITDLGTPTIAPDRETKNLDSPRRRRKQVKKKEISNINQKVNVLINNRSIGSQITNKRYLKVGAYA